MLRDYQLDILKKTLHSVSDDIVQLDTGGGKTHIIASIANSLENVIIVAHRNILVRQISKTMACFNVKHNIISSKFTRRACISEHRKLSKHIYCSKSNVHVASIDTLLSRYNRKNLTIDLSKKYTVIIDEGHHCTEKNKWGKLKKIFDCRLIAFTATPCRFDGQSLLKNNGGMFDKIIQATSLAENSVKTLIYFGYLSDFKIYSFDENIDLTALTVERGEYTIESQVTNIRTVVGCAVNEYKNRCKNKRALVICLNIENAEHTVKKFRDAGILSSAIHSKMSYTDIEYVLDMFKCGYIDVLCSVDMVGEGFDLPEIEALILLRKTLSFGLYRQWVGRSLRKFDGKKYSIILDHAGNVNEHGFPDLHVDWSDNNSSINRKTNIISCSMCKFSYFAYLTHCPECGEKNMLDERLGSEHVDIRHVDIALCEKKREMIKREYNLNNRLSIPEKRFNHNTFFGEICSKLYDKFVIILTENFSIKEVNLFMLKQSGRLNINYNTDFWVEHFSEKDLYKDITKKSLTIYRKILSNKI